jgi:hypothetical protein
MSAGGSTNRSAAPTSAIAADGKPDNGVEYLCSYDIAQEQANDPDIGPIYSLLAANNERPHWDIIAFMSDASKTLWRQW